MDERGRVLLASLVGGGIGALVGYLYFTESGRCARRQIEPKLDQVACEIDELRRTSEKARAVLVKLWEGLCALAEEPPRQGVGTAYGAGSGGSMTH